MPSVTGSPFDDELRCSAFALVPLFRTPCQPCRRLPIDSTCLRLKTSFSLSPPCLSLFPSSFLTQSVSVYSRFPSRSISAAFPSRFHTLTSRFLSRTLPVRLPFSLSLTPAPRRKVSRDFFVPFLSAARPGASPRAPFPRYRPISASQYSACAIVFF